jgi:hypothetical protein
LPHCSKRRDAARAQGKKLAAVHHDFRVQILNVAALISTRDSKPQTPNFKRRRQEGTQDVQSRRSRIGGSSVRRLARQRPAGELQGAGVARVIAATAIDGEVPIPTETICRSIETEGA